MYTDNRIAIRKLLIAGESHETIRRATMLSASRIAAIVSNLVEEDLESMSDGTRREIETALADPGRSILDIARQFSVTPGAVIQIQRSLTSRANSKHTSFYWLATGLKLFESEPDSSMAKLID